MAQGRMPTHIVKARTGRKDERDNDILQGCGVAWPFANGEGFSIQLNNLPIGFLLLSVRKED